jgi:single-stranded DNA-specific DHH superfamily exonuclease
MIQRIVITDHRAQMRTVTPDHAIALPRLTDEGPGKQATTAVGAVKKIAATIGLARLQRP